MHNGCMYSWTPKRKGPISHTTLTFLCYQFIVYCVVNNSVPFLQNILHLCAIKVLNEETCRAHYFCYRRFFLVFLRLSWPTSYKGQYSSIWDIACPSTQQDITHISCFIWAPCVFLRLDDWKFIIHSLRSM